MQTRQRVLLLDADAGVGNVTAVIDVPARRGLADMADSAPELWTDDARAEIGTLLSPGFLLGGRFRLGSG